MEERKLLLTILQISDLHIGSIDPVTGDAQVNNLTRQLFANFTCFDGVLGHHARALEDLADFYHNEMPHQDKAFLLVVSGDLTRVGDGVEFDAANDYLGATLVLPCGNVGLDQGAWRYHAITGNHDYWVGRPQIWGGPHTRLATYFPAGSFPYLRTLPLSNGMKLQIVGINTDDGVGPHSVKRGRAVGSFQNQLAAAAPLLKQRKEGRIRVLLMHHSYLWNGFFLSIDSGSRAALDQFLVTHGISVLMTGHTHEPLLRVFTPLNQRTVLECRCGTTTQVDQVPFAWRNTLGTFPMRKWPANTLLVHRVYDDNGNTVWEVETYYRDKRAGFQSVGFAGQNELRI